MKVLIIGSGGREHALAWKVARSPLVSRLFCAPGNAGTSFLAENVPIKADDIEGLTRFALEHDIGLSVVGPEQPLVMGVVDRFDKEGLPIFGPSAKAAELEGSKSFAKEFMKRHNIPTTSFETFSDPVPALEYVNDSQTPLVVKADGLAAGKGVFICRKKEEALDAIDGIMKQRLFGEAGRSVVIEEFLEGEEASYLAFTDGEHVLPLASSQDHKAIYNGDQGPNTGGMGACSPAPVMDREVIDRVTRDVAIPVVRGMKAEGRPFKGTLYAGLMLSDKGPDVLEFNCRLGDPETQPILHRMKSDIVPVIQATINGELDRCSIEWSDDPSVCVVMASEGYPGPYRKGLPISGLDERGGMDGAVVFHAGVAMKAGKMVTNGGRVLSVTASGPDMAAAIKGAYSAVSRISWDGAYYRNDIGRKALKADRKK